MKGDGEDSGLRNILSLGSSSRSTGSRSRSGERQDPSERTGASARDAASWELNPTMLSALSQNGLSLLAGDCGGRFSIKPPTTGNPNGMPSSGNLVSGGGRTSGGTFTGFYRAGAPQMTWGSSPAGMGLRFATEEAPARGVAAGTSSSHPQGSGNVGELHRTDVENLTPDECWSLVLKLGKRWPAWNATTSQLSQGVMKYRGPPVEGLDLGHHLHKDERLGGNPGNLQLGQDSLNLLTKRALEALAHTLDQYGRPASKPMTHEFSKRKATSDLPTPISQSTHPILAVSRQPTLSAQPSISIPRVMAAPTTSSTEPRTAPLTIFYDGQVNVCNNVPEDKARFIMLFAGSLRKNPTAQVPAPSASCAAPSTSASPQTTPGSVPAPEESPRPQEDLQLSRPSSHPVLVPGTSCFPSHLAPPRDHPGGSSSYQKPTESSIPAETANAAPPSMPFKIPVTEARPRQLMQQSLNGPVAKRLPNSRKNSLARFLDSRKRNKPAEASGEDPPSKKKEFESLSPGSSNVADDRQSSGKSPTALSSQSSVPISQGITTMPANDAEMKPNDSFMK